MRLTHKIVAVIGCAALAGAVQAGVKNGHFENRGSGNIYWQTCSVWTPSEVIIPNSGGTPLVRSGYALSIFRKQSDSTWLLTRDANLLPPPPKS